MCRAERGVVIVGVRMYLVPVLASYSYCVLGLAVMTRQSSSGSPFSYELRVREESPAVRLVLL